MLLNTCEREDAWVWYMKNSAWLVFVTLVVLFIQGTIEADMSSEMPQAQDDRAPQVPIQDSVPVAPLPALLDTKYSHLMTVVEEMGKYVKPCYSGSKTSVEKLRKEIQQARTLAKECLATVDLIGQQQDQQRN